MCFSQLNIRQRKKREVKGCITWLVRSGTVPSALEIRQSTVLI